MVVARGEAQPAQGGEPGAPRPGIPRWVPWGGDSLPSHPQHDVPTQPDRDRSPVIYVPADDAPLPEPPEAATESELSQ